MGNRVFSISYKKVRGGMEVIGQTRSDRGTKYISDSVVVLRGEKTEEEFKEALALATKTIYGEK